MPQKIRLLWACAKYHVQQIRCWCPFLQHLPGRYIDVNANVNILFGKKDFRFYLIGGIGFVYGLPHLLGDFDYRHEDEKTEEFLGYGLDSTQDFFGSNIGFNLGMGIEYQLKPAWLIFAKFEGSIGYSLLLNAATLKVGASFCF